MGRERWRDVATDHFDVAQQRFFNPWAAADKPFTDLLRWKATATRGAWPRTVTNRPYLAAPGAVDDGQAAVTFVGHSSVLVRVNAFTLLTDPVFARHAGPFGRLGPARVRPPGIAEQDLPAISAVFVSHNHYDHLDVAALRWLTAQRAPTFVVPLGLKRPLERRGIGPVIELDWWESADLNGAEIVVTPAQHWSNRTMFDLRRTLWGGCCLRVPYAPLVYFAGDTGYARFFADVRQRLGAPDVAFLPIGGYEPRWFMREAHMNPEEAVRAHQEVGARHSIAIHHTFFRLSDEAFDAPARQLADARAAAGIPPDHFRVLDVGETVVLGP